MPGTTKSSKPWPERYSFSLHVPTSELIPEDLQRILYGTGEETYEISLGGRHGSLRQRSRASSPTSSVAHRETRATLWLRDIERFMQEKPCHVCKGLRLKPEILAVTVA